MSSESESDGRGCAWCGNDASDGVDLKGRRFCSPQCAGRLTGSAGDSSPEPEPEPAPAPEPPEPVAEPEPDETLDAQGDARDAQGDARDAQGDAQDAQETAAADETDETDGVDLDEPGTDDGAPTATDADPADITVDADAYPDTGEIDDATVRTWPKPILDGTHVPESLRDMEIWALWSPAFGKKPMAPWKNGHCYKAKWAEEIPANERPETTYDKVQAVATLPPETIHQQYAFPPLDPDDDDAEPHIPDRVYPTILLPHDPPEPPIMQVDFDDVRDPDTGAVSPEVLEIIKLLDSYTEVSQSGTGLHVFVRAWLPGALGKFIADLDGVGHVEMYDHGRFVGCTWNQVGGTPDEVRECQDVVNALVKRYETEALRERRLRDPATGAGNSLAAQKARQDLDDIRDSFDIPDGSGSNGPNGSTKGGSGTSNPGGNADSSRYNPYFQIDPHTAAAEGDYGMDYQSHKTSGSWENGPHPGHGPEKSDISECTNFGINGDGWKCWACETGGGGLALLAVVADDSDVDVDCAGIDGYSDDPDIMLRVCLKAKEIYPALDDDDITPPYQALVGVAEAFDLTFADPDDQILGEQTHNIAEQIYHELTLAKLDDRS